MNKYKDINGNEVSFLKSPKDICFFNINNERYILYTIYIDKETKDYKSRFLEFDKDNYYKLLKSNNKYKEVKLHNFDELCNLMINASLEPFQQNTEEATLGDYLKLS